MPNPTSLPTGNPGSVAASIASQVIALSSEYAWDVFHTGHDESGGTEAGPVWLAINEGAVSAEASESFVLLPPGQAFTFPKGTRQVAYLATTSGGPVLVFLSSREGVK